jgi:hypothetical protein
MWWGAWRMVKRLKLAVQGKREKAQIGCKKPYIAYWGFVK